MPQGQTEQSAQTISFEQFWSWLQTHCNCILRAGTPDVLLFDHEDYHWHLAPEDEHLSLIQLIRGKALVAEMAVLFSEISYVQYESGDRDEYMFECIVETSHARDCAYHFVMAHSFEEQEPASNRWTH